MDIPSNSRRFALLSEEDMVKLGDKAVNANTSRSTKNWIVTFGEWATIRGKNPKLEDYIHNKADMD